MLDEDGVPQLHTISPQGGPVRQITDNSFPIESAFSWHPDGQRIAVIAGNSVCEVDVATGETTRLTEPTADAPLRPEACVYSPDGAQIAYLRRVTTAAGVSNQIYVVPSPRPLTPDP